MDEKYRQLYSWLERIGWKFLLIVRITPDALLVYQIIQIGALAGLAHSQDKPLYKFYISLIIFKGISIKWIYK